MAWCGDDTLRTLGEHENLVKSARKLSASRWQRAILAAILFIAAALRFYNITEKGLFSYDESYLLTFSRAALRFAKLAVDNLAPMLQGTVEPSTLIAQVLRDSTAMSFYLSKPMHLSLALLGAWIFGGADYSVGVLMAILGVATVAIAYLLGRRLYGVGAGLLAAGLLAVSPWHVGMSRTGKELADTLFFLSLASLLYVVSRQECRTRLSFFSGLILGLALSTNHITWPIAAVSFPLAELLFWRQGGAKEFRRRARLSAFMLLGVAVPVLVFFSLTLLANRLIDSRLYVFPFAAFFGVAKNTGRGEGQLDVLYYARFLWLREGPAFALLVAAAGIWLVWRLRRHPRFEDTLILFQSVVYVFILGLLTSSMNVFSRTGSVVLVACYVALGGFLTALLRRLHRSTRAHEPRKRMAIATLWFVAVASLLSFSIPKAIEVTQMRSGFREAAEWILAQGDGVVYYPIHWPQMEAYLGHRDRLYLAPVSSPCELYQAYKDGEVDYIGLDYWMINQPPDKTWQLQLTAGQSPAARIPHPVGRDLMVVSDTQRPADICRVLENPDSDWIFIYRLSDVFHSDPCQDALPEGGR